MKIVTTKCVKCYEECIQPNASIEETVAHLLIRVGYILSHSWSKVPLIKGRDLEISDLEGSSVFMKSDS